MADCCLTARMHVGNDVHAKVGVDENVKASVGVGTVVIRDGTNDYNRLVNKPSIEGVELRGNKTLPQIGVGLITEQDIDRIIYG